jgi:hypothetical protein
MGGNRVRVVGFQTPACPEASTLESEGGGLQGSWRAAEGGGAVASDGASLDSALEASDPDLLLAEVADIQRFVAELPDRDRRSPDEILGFDAAGLPS